ncbi:MAG: DUF4258 domain-containing protein [Candidatus Kapaibacterium sp.]
MFEKIRMCFERQAVIFSKHAAMEMLHESFGEIFTQDVYDAVLSGECLREYREDKPLSSCLVFGRTGNQRPVHAVCGYDEERNRAVVITVYEPNPALWINFRERK